MTFPLGAATDAPADAIFGIAEAYASDRRLGKVNLAVGVYVDEHGNTPVLASVLEAERRLVARAETKAYRPIPGAPGYRAAVLDLLFGPGNATISDGRALAAQTPGGTGALRVAADFIRQTGGGRTVWLPDPTWPNHPQLFGLAGYRVRSYPYLDRSGRVLDEAALLSALSKADRGDIVLFHGSCHNPTGIDPSMALWGELVDLLTARELLPIVDFAYQGFGIGLREDSSWLKVFERSNLEFLICSSFSKNLSLYNERVGALTVVSRDAARAAAAMSHVKIAIRSNYSNPPAHGADVAEMILCEPSLRAQWEMELARMRGRIQDNRGALVDQFGEQKVPGEWSSLRTQRGMFALLGLTDSAVKRLRDEFAVYMTSGGRVNLAGLNAENLDRVVDAVSSVLGAHPAGRATG